jgi:hypothetical protein
MKPERQNLNDESMSKARMTKRSQWSRGKETGARGEGRAMAKTTDHGPLTTDKFCKTKPRRFGENG